MVETQAGPERVVATFRLPDVHGAESAHVVGEFNEWSHTAHPMVRTGDGFQAQIALDPGRAYRFRYLLDGERWENDWNADAYVPNEFGGDDSVIDLTDVKLAASAPAKKRATRPRAKATDAKADGKTPKPPTTKPPTPKKTT
jgi:1,4-alpha-glucan branching enzyme